MEVLFLAAGATAAATFLYCTIRGVRGGGGEPVRIDPGIGRTPDSAQVYDLEVARKAFLIDSNDEWRERVAMSRENSLAEVLKEVVAVDEGNEGDEAGWIYDPLEMSRHPQMASLPLGLIYDPLKMYHGMRFGPWVSF